MHALLSSFATPPCRQYVDAMQGPKSIIHNFIFIIYVFRVVEFRGKDDGAFAVMLSS